MLNSIANFRQDNHIEPKSQKVGDTSQYEGKDNAGGGYYRRQQKQAQEEKKPERPKGNNTIDLLA